MRSLRLTRRSTASENPACLNSLRKASPSFAPAIHANQSDSLARASGGKGCDSMSSAAYTVPAGRTTRASSRKIASPAGFRLKMPLTMATSISLSLIGSRSASDSRSSALTTPDSATAWRARDSIALLKSTPMTFPVPPTLRAAMIVSVPEPQPKSRTVAPTGGSANRETFETPANASHFFEEVLWGSA